MFKKIISIILIISLIQSYQVNAIEVINKAPTSSFNVIKRNKVDIVVATDYIGKKLADLQTKLNNLKIENLNNNGVDINYIIVGNKVKIGTVTKPTITKYNYARYITLKLKLNGPVGPYTYYRDYEYTTNIPYEETSLYDDEHSSSYRAGKPVVYADNNDYYGLRNLPTFLKSSNVYFEHKYKTSKYGGTGEADYSKGSGDKDSYTHAEYISSNYQKYYFEYYFYDLNNRDTTLVWDKISVDPSWLLKAELISYSDGYKWTYANSETLYNKTSDMYAIDFSKLNSVSTRKDAEKYIMLLSDNDTFNTYNRSYGQYYGLGNMRNDNIKSFIDENKAHFIAVTPETMKDEKIGTHGVIFSDTKKQQNISIDELLKSTSNYESRYYTNTELDKALNNIAFDNQAVVSKNIDYVISTDYSGDKLAALENKFNTLKTELAEKNYNLNYKIFNNSVTVGKGKTTNLKIVKGCGNIFYLKTDNSLWVTGTNNAGITGYSPGGSVIKVEDNVKDVAVSNGHICILKTDGTVWVAGNNQYGQLGLGDFVNRITLTKNITISSVSQIAITSYATFFIKNFGFFMAGATSYESQKNNNIISFGINGFTNIKKIFTDLSTACYIVTGADDVFYMGHSSSLNYRDRNSNYYIMQYPTKIPELSGKGIKQIETISDKSIALTNDGKIIQWGRSEGLSSINISQVGNFSNIAESIIYTGYIYMVSKPDSKTNNSSVRVLDGSGNTNYLGEFNSIYKMQGYNGCYLVTKSGIIYSVYPEAKYDVTGGYLYTRYNIGKDISFSDTVNIDIQTLDIEPIKTYINSLNKNNTKYFSYISDGKYNGFELGEKYGEYYGFGNLTSDFGDFLNGEDFSIYSMVPEHTLNFKLTTPYIDIAVQDIDIDDLLDKVQNKQNYLDWNFLSNNLKAKFKNTFIGSSETNSSIIILNNESIDYNVLYGDYEEDPQYSEQWMYTHSLYFENSSEIISYNNTWVSKKTSFNLPGKYIIKCRVKDNPLNHYAFDEYKLWGEPSKTIILYVHRAPIAMFTYKLTESGTSFIPTFTSTSYDLDRYSTVNKGINTSTVIWKWKEAMDLSWTSGKPTTFASNSDYYVSLQVQDVDGAWSEPYIEKISTLNFPPDISANPMSYEGSDKIKVNVTVTDKSNDLISSKYQWTQSTDKPTSWLDPSDWIATKTTSKYNYYSIPIPDAGTWYLHVDAEDEYGNYRYTIFGPYIVNTIKIHDFTVTSMSDLNWRDYYFSSSDSNSDGKLEYLAKNNVNITTIKMPINYYGLVSNSNNAVKAGATVKGFILIDGSPDSGILTAKYTDINNAVKFKDLNLTTANELTYFWQMIIPKDIKQDTFIEFSVFVNKSNVNYNSSYWIDIWDDRNTTRKVFFVHGSVMSTIKNNQTH